jgi:hypothetical protein
MALELRLPRFWSPNHTTKVASSSATLDQLPISPDQLRLAAAWYGDSVEVGRLIVGDTSERPVETERWGVLLADTRDNPFTAIKACEYRGPIRGLALFERLRGIRLSSTCALREMYIRPPDNLMGEADRMTYTLQVAELLLDEANLCLSAIGVTPLPHNHATPQVWPYGRPQ